MVPPDYHREKVQRILEGDDMTEKEIIQVLRRCASGESEEECPFTKKYGCDGCPKVSADLIERLTAENAALREKQRWIPVTERMPELEVPVLVLDRRGNMIVRTLRRLVSDKEAVFRPDGLAPRKNITHWMPLPSAPKFADILRGALEEGDKHE